MIARQTIVPAVGSPQRPTGAAESGCAECDALREQVARLSTKLAAEEGKKRLLTEGLTAARQEIMHQRETIAAKDAELEVAAENSVNMEGGRGGKKAAG